MEENNTAQGQRYVLGADESMFVDDKEEAREPITLEEYFELDARIQDAIREQYRWTKIRKQLNDLTEQNKVTGNEPLLNELDTNAYMFAEG